MKKAVVVLGSFFILCFLGTTLFAEEPVKKAEGTKKGEVKILEAKGVVGSVDLKEGSLTIKVEVEKEGKKVEEKLTFTADKEILKGLKEGDKVVVTYKKGKKVLKALKVVKEEEKKEEKK